MKRGTPDHPKVYSLAETLHIAWPHAVGILELLWHYTSRYAPQGNIGKWKDDAIAEACGWKKNPKALVDALCEHGWLDRDPDHRLLVHDWSEHCDQSVRKTLKNNQVDFIKCSSRHVVYFIRAEHSRAIKIGVTGRSGAERLRELKSNTLEPLEIILEVEGGYALESQIQERFKSIKKRGEWYSETEELLLFIKELASFRSGKSEEKYVHSGQPSTFIESSLPSLSLSKPSQAEPSLAASENDFPNEHAKVEAVLPPLELDEQWTAFRSECEQRGVFCGVSPTDWSKARQAWKPLNSDQKARALVDIRERDPDAVEIRAPALPANYIRDKKWERSRAVARNGPAKLSENVNVVAAKMAWRGK